MTSDSQSGTGLNH